MESTVSMAAIMKAVAGLLAALGLAGGVAFTMSGDDGDSGKNVSTVASKPSGDVSCLLTPKEGAPQQAEQQAANVETVANTAAPTTPPSQAPAPQSVDGNCPQGGGSNPTPAEDPVVKGLPLWELISNAPSKEGRLYTTSNDEFKSAVEVHKLTPEPAGVAKVSPTSFEGATPIYRLRNDQLNTWIYSIDTSKGGEKEKLLGGTQAGPGWKEEGITGYIQPAAKPGLDKLYRLHKDNVNEWRLALGEAKAKELDANGYSIDGDLQHPMGYAAPVPADVKPPAATPPAAPAPVPAAPAAPAMSKEEKHCRDAGSRFVWNAAAKRCDYAPGAAPTTKPTTPAPAPEKKYVNCSTQAACEQERRDYMRYYNDVGPVTKLKGTAGEDSNKPWYFSYGAHK